MKKRKGFTLIELVIAMAVVITMSGVTLSSNIYNEKEALNNVAVKCQIMIEAARNTAIAQRAPREVRLNYAQNQITSGEPGGEIVETYAFPAPVTFVTGGADLTIYFDAFGKLETYDKENRLTDVFTDVFTDVQHDYLSFFLTNKTAALVEEIRIYRDGGGVDLIWGGEGTPTVGGDPVVKISGPTVGEVNTNYTYSSTVQGGKPPYIYVWGTTVGGNPGSGTASTFTTQWGGSGTITLTVKDSSGKSTEDSRDFAIATPLIAFIIGEQACKLDTVYSYTVNVLGGAVPYSYAWTVVPDGNPYAGRASTFTTQWTTVGTKTINLTVTDSLLQRVICVPFVITVYSAPAGSIEGTESGLINTSYTYTSNFSGGKGPFTYLWSNGGTAINSNYSWAAPGTYIPSVTVTDALGQTGTANNINVNIQSTITFNKNGGTTEANPTSRTADYNTSLGVLPIAPTKTGYTFTSWNTIVGGTGTTFTGATPVTANITVYAQWTANVSSTITIAGGTGGMVSPLTTTLTYAGSAVTITAEATDGYHFVSWAVTDNPSYVNLTNSGAAVTTISATSSLPQGGTATVTATFAANVSGAITIVGGTNLWRQATSNTDFDGRGNGVITATNSGGVITYEYAYNQNLTWTYHGQSLAMVSGSQYYAGMDVYISPDANISATGTTWVADIEGGCGGGFFYDNTKKGTWQRLEITQMATAASGAMYLYPSTSAIYATTGLVRYKNVTFSSNQYLGTTTLTYKGSAAPIAAPTATGYHFVNWEVTVNAGYVSIADASAASTTIAATSSMPQGGTATVKAILNSNVSGAITIAAGTNGSVAPTSTILAYTGSTVAITATPATGYHFVSWAGTNNPSYVSITNSGVAATTISATSNMPQGGAATVTANFAINQYTVTFKNWDGTVLSTPSVNYGGTAPAPGNPTRTGYTFAAWDRVLTNITAATPITATYNINSYLITASSTAVGSITGSQWVAYGGSVTFNITPSSGYTRWYTLVDGVNQGAIASYTFSNVAVNHTIDTHFYWYGITGSSAGLISSGSYPIRWLAYGSDGLGHYTYWAATYVPAPGGGQYYNQPGTVTSLPSGYSSYLGCFYTANVSCFSIGVVTWSSSIPANSILTVYLYGPVYTYGYYWY